VVVVGGTVVVGGLVVVVTGTVVVGGQGGLVVVVTHAMALPVSANENATNAAPANTIILFFSFKVLLFFRLLSFETEVGVPVSVANYYADFTTPTVEIRMF
jgi:hypothetical protein